MSNKPKRPVISDNDIIFATMNPKEAREFTGGYDKDKIKFMREVKSKLHAQERFDAARKVQQRKEKPYYMYNPVSGALDNVNATPTAKKSTGILDYVSQMQKMYGEDK